MIDLSHNKTIKRLCRDQKFMRLLNEKLHQNKRLILPFRNGVHASKCYVCSALYAALSSLDLFDLFAQKRHHISYGEISKMADNMLEILKQSPDWQ